MFQKKENHPKEILDTFILTLSIKNTTIKTLYYNYVRFISKFYSDYIPLDIICFKVYLL